VSDDSNGDVRQRNIKLLIEYDGTDYKGWQIQPDQRTIQGEIESCLGRLLNHKTRVTAAGRTDTGVHAMGQIANFYTPSGIATERILNGLNSLLPNDISVGEVKEVSKAFHARFDARRRSYQYRISFRPTALNHRFVWRLKSELDLDAMRVASGHLVGHHDFTSFCVSAEERDTRGCHIHKCCWQQVSSELHLSIDANRFLRSMVRGIVGTLVQVGRGKRTPQDIVKILEARDRRRAGPNAPPQGLFLREVSYGEDSGE
jgi:tRNA pseudouridine38-40 synthase